MARTRISLQSNPVRGVPMEIRTMIAHAMETGYRPGADGAVIARNLIRRFRCSFDDGTRIEPVFEAELFPAVAANPYIAFHFTPPGNGSLRFVWEGDQGFVQTETLDVRVA